MAPLDQIIDHAADLQAQVDSIRLDIFGLALGGFLMVILLAFLTVKVMRGQP